MLSLWNSTQRFFCGENLPIDHLFLFSKKNVDAFLIPLQLTQPKKIMWGIKGLFLMGDLVKLEFLPSPMLLMVMGCRSWADSISTALFSLVFSENLRNFRTILLLLSVNLLLIFSPHYYLFPSSDGTERHVILSQKHWMMMWENGCDDPFSQRQEYSLPLTFMLLAGISFRSTT